MKWTKSILTSLLLMSALMLGACGEENINAEEIDLRGYPEAVQNGDISVEYYKEILRFYDEYIGYLETLNELLETPKEFPHAIQDDKYVKLAEDTVNSYNNSLLSFTTKPKTNTEESINEHLENVIELQLSFNESLMEQIENKNGLDENSLYIKMSVLSKVFKEMSAEIEKFKIIE